MRSKHNAFAPVLGCRSDSLSTRQRPEIHERISDIISYNPIFLVHEVPHATTGGIYDKSNHGGDGFIGAEVVNILLETSEKNPILFSRNPMTKRFSKTSGNADAISGDLGSFEDILKAVQRTKPDVIYYIGALLPGFTESDTAGGIQANAMGTFHVLEAKKVRSVLDVIIHPGEN